MKKIVAIVTFLSFLIAGASSAQAQVVSIPRDGFYDKVNIVDKKPIPYVFVREADVIWSKRIWRVIDMRERVNQPFYYPEVPQNQWRSLITVIMDGLKEGQITAYDASVPTDEFLVPLTYEEVMSRLERTDTVQLQRNYPPYDYYDTIIQTEFNAMDVKRIRIKEDWFFDKQRSMMEARVLGICPVRDNLDENGNFRGYETLFWVYYPEARETFAKAEVYNPNNDAQRLTYDDVFWKRIFHSTVYKESNRFDRRISEYATGIDALLESERINRDLHQYEHDFWEF
ncbi:MAG: gliding motility protein GldN [Bacteroidales bacterium]|nr:gliding motility protein GldN [Bacteroidales bacterium]